MRTELNIPNLSVLGKLVFVDFGFLSTLLESVPHIPFDDLVLEGS